MSDFLLFCLYCKLAGNCWKLHGGYFALQSWDLTVQSFLKALFWAVIPYLKDERNHDFSIYSHLCIPALYYLVLGGWYMHVYTHTHTHIDTKPHRVAPYWSPVGSEGFFDTNHSKPYNGKISSQPVCYEQRQKPDVTDLLGSFPQVWGAWDEMAALCPLHFRDKKECIRSTAPHTCLVQPPSSLGQPEPSAPASPILSYYSNHNIPLKKS